MTLEKKSKSKGKKGGSCRAQGSAGVTKVSQENDGGGWGEVGEERDFHVG